jgi:hypothetical protein
VINIVVNQQKQIIEIESKRTYQFSNITDAIDLAPVIKDILDCAYYSGERLCLETVDVHGHYTEQDRWD